MSAHSSVVYLKMDKNSLNYFFVHCKIKNCSENKIEPLYNMYDMTPINSIKSIA